MSFSKEQVELLRSKLDPSAISSRKQSGMTLDYVEGWWTIDKANEIFGFHGWERETCRLECVSAEPKPSRKDPKKHNHYVSYIAQVRVRVSHEGGQMSRMGTGFGQGIDSDLGKAHDNAAKTAETDAMKRALITFGNQFGLALYDDAKTGVLDPEVGGLARKVESLLAQEFGDAAGQEVQRCIAEANTVTKRNGNGFKSIDDMPRGMIEKWISKIETRLKQREVHQNA